MREEEIKELINQSTSLLEIHKISIERFNNIPHLHIKYKNADMVIRLDRIDKIETYRPYALPSINKWYIIGDKFTITLSKGGYTIRIIELLETIKK
jgi:hypothetical protein